VAEVEVKELGGDIAGVVAEEDGGRGGGGGEERQSGGHKWKISRD